MPLKQKNGFITTALRQLKRPAPAAMLCINSNALRQLKGPCASSEDLGLAQMPCGNLKILCRRHFANTKSVDLAKPSKILILL
jgi:hypothetical protein